MPFSIAGPASPAIPSLDGINRVAQRISSGISVEPRDNAAESAISGRLDSSIGESTVNIRNITDQISSLQRADDTLGYVSDLVERAQALDIQGNNGALSEADRATIQTSRTELLQEAVSNLDSANFNGQPLFANQAGNNLRDSLEQAISSGAPLNDVQDQVNTLRAENGASQAGLSGQVDQLALQREVDSGRNSRISDTDLAVEMANLIREELQFKASVEVFRRDTIAKDTVLGLLSQ